MVSCCFANKYRCCSSTKAQLPNEIGDVATAWTGVDMSTPLLPGVVPEIDANPASFYGVGLQSYVPNWETDVPFSVQKMKVFHLQGASLCPWTPRPPL